MSSSDLEDSECEDWGPEDYAEAKRFAYSHVDKYYENLGKIAKLESEIQKLIMGITKENRENNNSKIEEMACRHDAMGMASDWMMKIREECRKEATKLKNDEILKYLDWVEDYYKGFGRGVK